MGSLAPANEAQNAVYTYLLIPLLTEYNGGFPYPRCLVPMCGSV